MTFYPNPSAGETIAQNSRKPSADVAAQSAQTGLPHQVAANEPVGAAPSNETAASSSDRPQSPAAAGTTQNPNSSNASKANAPSPAAPAHSFTATAYSLRGRTASGRNVSRGLIAADRRVLPLGTRVRLDAGHYSGEYLVADTGGAVRGRKIDIWVPSTGEAVRFGRRAVRLTVLTRERNRQGARR